MGLVDLLLRRPTAYGLRKHYDRLRERTDRLGNIEKRIEILRMLDQIEPSIISLEEHHMSRFEKKKIADYIETNMRKVKFMLDESKRKHKVEEGFKPGSGKSPDMNH